MNHLDVLFALAEMFKGKIKAHVGKGSDARDANLDGLDGTVGLRARVKNPAVLPPSYSFRTSGSPFSVTDVFTGTGLMSD